VKQKSETIDDNNMSSGKTGMQLLLIGNMEMLRGRVRDALSALQVM
jgi:hypothetical protein